MLAASGRACGFLSLLCQLSGRTDLLASLATGPRVRVEAEAPLPAGSSHLAMGRRGWPRRMDLVFRSRVDPDCEIEAVAEAKLAAALRPRSSARK